MMASNYPPQAVALPGYHYRMYGRFCALPSRASLGRTVTVTYKVHGHWSAPIQLLVADICGTPGRVDLPQGTFLRLFGRDGVHRGLMPIRILSMSKAKHHAKHKAKHGPKHHAKHHVITRIGTAWRGEYRK